MDQLSASPPRLPLDHPTPSRPHRVYLALTNACNRACPWCSTCSSPHGQTWFPLEQLEHVLPTEGPFELQLEGGEPTLHPQFWGFVAAARAHPRCTRCVLCTNGVRLPRTSARLTDWLERLGAPLTLKLSINHVLLEHDPGLLALATLLSQLMPVSDPQRLLVLNVRLRPTGPEQDQAVREQVRAAGLLDRANVFFLQRYGFAEDELEWERPSVVGQQPPVPGQTLEGTAPQTAPPPEVPPDTSTPSRTPARPFTLANQFTLVNPDGSLQGQDLRQRSEAMRALLSADLGRIKHAKTERGTEGLTPA